MGEIMKVVQINAVSGLGSTGKICASISEMLDGQGIENYILFSAGKSSHPKVISCCNWIYTKLQAGKSRIKGNYGFNSVGETRRMIALLEQIKPDVVHLHNLHGHDCNLELLFAYLKKKELKVLWTFHDCWAFTGYCTHFSYEQCSKWKTQCHSCPQRSKYSLLFDRSREVFERKKATFSGLDMTIITPSQWLADLVKESFLKEYPVKVIENGIDLDVFCPRDGDCRKRYAIPEEKFVLLGVAQGWGFPKGLDVFIELSHRLDPARFQIVLVGTDDQIDRKLPKNVISIHRTNDPHELAEIYSASDLFVNPTREDTYPTVNMESIACGTPVLTFRTGGSPEILSDRTGSAVDCDDIDAMEQEILRIYETRPYSRTDCVQRGKDFCLEDRFSEYLKLYGEIKG